MNTGGKKRKGESKKKKKAQRKNQIKKKALQEKLKINKVCRNLETHTHTHFEVFFATILFGFPPGSFDARFHF